MIILYIILGLIALLLIAAAFGKPEFSIIREITINKPKQQVFDYVRFLKNQEQFSKWVMTDPNMKKTITGTDGTVGAVYIWDSENKQAGKGEQEITDINEGERIDFEIRFEKPFNNTSEAYFTTVAVSDNQTKVSWAFIGTTTYFMRVLHLLLNLKKVLGKDMQTSLNNLKRILESK